MTATWARTLCALLTLAFAISCGTPSSLSAGVERQAAKSNDDVIVAKSVQHLPGLDEHVTLALGTHGSSGWHKFAVRATGHRQPIAELRRAESTAREARFGAMTPELDELVRLAHPQAGLPVAILFDPLLNWDDLGPRLRSVDDEVRFAARDEFRAAIATRGGAVVGGIIERGLSLTNVSIAEAMPAIFATAKPPSLRAIARLSDIVAIMPNRPSVAHWEGVSTPNSVTDARIDIGFNDLGFFGEGQRIGVVEGIQCGWYGGHEVFQFASIHYEVPPAACAGIDDCNICRRGISLAVPIRCMDTGVGTGFRCVEDHASEMAGCIAVARAGTPHGAAKASLHFPNLGVPNVPLDKNPGVACQIEGIAHAYAWMAEQAQNVTTTSEAFICLPQEADGVTQDWFARHFGFAIFRAAGNNPGVTTGLACRSLNSTCVGGNTANGAIWPSSTWKNPPSSDREEPDITGLAVDVDVMGFTSSGSFVVGVGTSFAAPIMAGFAALLKQACGGALDPRSVRAIMRTSAWSKNVDGAWAYSTPIGGFDNKDGAGEPTADNAVLFCLADGGTGPNVKRGTFDVPLKNVPSVPAWVDDTPSKPPDGGPDPSKAQPRVGEVFFSTPLEAGDRIRITFTWDSCPATNKGSGPLAIATDFDIVMCDNDKQTCLGAGSSQSFDDNAEGFDVVVPAAGTWSVWYLFDASTPGCKMSTEAVSWAVAWGSPSAFH